MSSFAEVFRYTTASSLVVLIPVGLLLWRIQKRWEAKFFENFWKRERISRRIRGD